MPDVFKVADILVKYASATHKDDIALIVYSGSYAREQASPTSDLDIFYIPDDGQAQSLSSQFVLDGLPYDFWPMPWSFVEAIAEARGERPWAVAAALIADARVLYSRSPQDLARFNELQQRIADSIKPESHKFMLERALDAFKTTLFQLGQLRLAVSADDIKGVYWAAWNFANSVVNALALANQTYFTKGWGANFSQLGRLTRKPADLEELLTTIVFSSDVDTVLETADRLAHETRQCLVDAQAAIAQPVSPAELFTDFYPFVFEYVQKVLTACAGADKMAAAYAACQLQVEICQYLNQVEPGFYGSEFNLLGEYSSAYTQAGFPDLLESASTGDLKELARRATVLDRAISRWLDEQGIDRNLLKDGHDLRRFLHVRDVGE